MAEASEIGGKLFPGSWAGIPIYFVGASMEGGRKATSRPILNSDRQVISDTGQKLPVYEMRGLVSARYGTPDANGNRIIEEYGAFRDRLLRILRSGQSGILVHPFEGPIGNLVCTKFSLNETIREAGIAELSMTLEVHSPGAFVVTSGAGSADVDGDAGLAEKSILEKMALSAGIDPKTVGAFKDGLAKVQSVYEGVQAAAQTVEAVAADITGFAQDVNQLVEDASSILLTPLDLVNSIEAVFIAVENVFPTFEARFDAMVNGFAFGDSDTPYNTTTAGGRAKQRFQDVINAGVQAFFLTNAYRAATGLEIVTIDQLNDIEAKLDAQHAKLVSNPALEGDATDGLQTLRESFNAFLSDARLTAFKIADADVGPNTSRTLAYQLYESDENAEILASINGVEKYELLRGSVRVLSL